MDKAREHSVAIASLPPPTQCCHCQSPTTNTVLSLPVSHHQHSVCHCQSHTTNTVFAIVSLPPPTQCCHCQSPTTNTVLPLSVSHHQHSVAIVSLPPHSTHKMQPLDVGFVKPLKTCYAQEIETWLGSSAGRVVLSLLVCKLVCKLFRTSYRRTTTL